MGVTFRLVAALANRMVALGKFAVYDMIVVEFSDL